MIRSDTKSAGSFGIIAEAIEGYSQKQVEKRLTAMNIDLEILQPVEIVQVNAADDKSGRQFYDNDAAAYDGFFIDCSGRHTGSYGFGGRGKGKRYI
jgi:hypothetical protein